MKFSVASPKEISSNDVILHISDRNQVNFQNVFNLKLNEIQWHRLVKNVRRFLTQILKRFKRLYFEEPTVGISQKCQRQRLELDECLHVKSYYRPGQFGNCKLSTCEICDKLFLERP